MSLPSKLFRCFVFFTLIPLLLCSALAEAVSLEEKVVEFEYANGLRLMVVDRPETPVVSAYITIGVGSVHETSETRGVAHLLEHMLFKGTKVLGTTDYASEKPLLEQIETVGSEIDRLRLNPQSDPEQIMALSKKLQELQADHKRFVVKDVFSKIYAENGGVGYNAFTGKDLTTYLISLPSNKLELWALIESDRMQNAVLREFYTERDVIREERRRSYETSPGGLIYETLLANAFTVHPYRDPIIGWHSDIANLSLAETRTFLEDYYAPINTVIALVGDVRPAKAFDLVNQYFGSIPPGTPVPNVAANEPVQNAEKRVTVFFDAEPQLSIAFHKPTLPHKDDYVFDLIDQILAQGRTSRFYQNLVEDLKVATSVSAYMAPGSRYPNLFVINAVPRYPHSAEEVEQAIYSELEKLKDEPVADEELLKARNRLVTDQLRYLKSNNGLARMLTSYQSMVGDWRYLVNYQNEIEKITADDIMAAARAYFVSKNRTVVTLIRGENNNAPKS
ncbi:MAG: insulinase family protein [Deltaproteobacteria bacterium]|jgi:predicted Zn-dependent peptidase|nr:insulinase family protein [Deltaproteobacteria bacterium]